MEGGTVTNWRVHAEIPQNLMLGNQFGPVMLSAAPINGEEHTRHIMTRSTSLMAVSAVSLLALTACVSPDRSANNDFKKTTTGAAIGAGVGIVGGLISGDTPAERKQNALKAGLIGAAGGAVVGNVLDKQAAELQQSLGNDRVTITNTGDRLIVTLPQDILFASDSAVLSGGIQGDLFAVANNLQSYPNSTVQVIGHTDSSGEAGYNQNLSVQRANSVVNVLAGAGVPRTRLQGIGRGEDQPIASNLTEDGKAQNRRVEIVILPTS